MNLAVETIIIGGGQAGLALSYYLKQRNHEHIVLEAVSQPAFAWREQRWDSFTLLTPNWALRLPGAHYDGPDPHGFLPREQILAYFEGYAQRNQLPIQLDSRVTSVEPTGNGSGYRVSVNGQDYRAQNVVVATGLFQQPKIPNIGQSISRRVQQLHSATYRNPEQLPAGAVLVVGSAQSGCQIAEELYQAGRQAYLCLSSAGRGHHAGRGSVEYAACSLAAPGGRI